MENLGTNERTNERMGSPPNYQRISEGEETAPDKQANKQTNTYQARRACVFFNGGG